MKKIVSMLLIILLLMSVLCTNQVFASKGSGGGTGSGTGIDGIITSMSGVSSAPDNAGTSGTTKVINNIIGIMQIVGTGISLIVISLLGIKYILASPSDKADVKKNIMPILIGCVLLFAAVNIAGIIENFTSGVGLVGKTGK